MNINYVEGDATAPIGDGPKIIAHICNDIGGWGRGFVLALSARWNCPEVKYRHWHADRDKGGDFRLGATQLCQVGDDLHVANMIAQRDVSTVRGVPPIRYEAVKSCLCKLEWHAARLGASVHMPRIGCGLAGGSWDRIGPIVQSELADHSIAVTVYDLPGGA